MKQSTLSASVAFCVSVMSFYLLSKADSPEGTEHRSGSQQIQEKIHGNSIQGSNEIISNRRDLRTAKKLELLALRLTALEALVGKGAAKQSETKVKKRLRQEALPRKTLAERHEEELVDSVWAPAMETDLRSQLEKDVQLLSLVQADCRQSSCRLEVRYPANSKGKKQFNTAVLNLDSFRRKQIVKKSVENGEKAVIVYLANPK